MKSNEKLQELSENITSNERANWLLGILIAAFFVFQLFGINNEPWEEYDSWRQTDTYTIAQNYVQFNMNPLKPQFNYDGAGDNYVQLELQVMPWLSSIVYQLIGHEPYAVPRLISLAFFIGSIIFVFKISKRFFSSGASLCAATIYMSLPISVLYSRAIMPEAAALFFYTAGIYFFLKWYESSSTRALYASAIFTALAIMEKTPVIFIGIMFVALFFKKEKISALKKPYFYGFGAISVGVPLVYYIYSSSVATFTFVNNIAEKHVFSGIFTAIFTPQAANFFTNEAPRFFGVVAISAAVLGLVCCILKKNSPLVLWAGAMILETITIVAIIRFGYYLVFLAPLVAVLCGALFNFVGRKNAAAGLIVSVICIGGVLAHTAVTVKPMIAVKEEISLIAADIKSVTKLDDVIAVAAEDPVILGAANRRGYRANLGYYSYIPTNPPDELAYFMDNGVQYFVVMNNEIPGDDGEYLKLLTDGYDVALESENCKIFDLGESKNARN